MVVSNIQKDVFVEENKGPGYQTTEIKLIFSASILVYVLYRKVVILKCENNSKKNYHDSSRVNESQLTVVFYWPWCESDQYYR